MKKCLWLDEQGIKHLSLIRDNDPESEAKFGVPQDPPDILGLDWQGIAIELHNLLVDRELISKQDVMKKPGQLENAIKIVVGRKIKQLYQGGN